MAIASVIAPASQQGFNTLTENPSVVGADSIPFFDQSANANRRATFSDFQTAVLTGVTSWAGFGKEGVSIDYASLSTVSYSIDRIVLGSDSGVVIRADGVSGVADLTASDADGLDTGSEASNTWYYLWIISTGSIHKALISTSGTSPTMPLGYTYKAIAGIFYNGSDGHIVPFSQRGDRVFWAQSFQVQTLSQTTVGTTQTIDFAAETPPVMPSIARSVSGFIHVLNQNSDNNGWLLLDFGFNTLETTDAHSFFTVAAAPSASKGSYDRLTFDVRVGGDSNIYVSTTSGAGTPTYSLGVYVNSFTF